MKVHNRTCEMLVYTLRALFVCCSRDLINISNTRAVLLFNLWNTFSLTLTFFHSLIDSSTFSSLSFCCCSLCADLARQVLLVAVFGLKLSVVDVMKLGTGGLAKSCFGISNGMYVARNVSFSSSAMI